MADYTMHKELGKVARKNENQKAKRTGIKEHHQF